MHPTRLLWFLAILAALWAWRIDRAPEGPRGITPVDAVPADKSGDGTKQSEATNPPDPRGFPWVSPPVPETPPTFLAASAPDLATPVQYEQMIRGLVPTSQPNLLLSGTLHHIRTLLDPARRTANNPTGEILFNYEYLTENLPMLGVTAPPSTHSMLATLAADLRRVERRQVPTPWPVGMSLNQYARRMEIERALAQSVPMYVAHLPARKVIVDLAREMDLEVSFDRKSLEDEGIDVDLPINLNLLRASGRSVLELTLGEFGATFRADDQLWVTSRVVAEDKLSLWIYDVEPLLAGMRNWNAFLLNELIQDLVAPPSWKDVGGQGKAFPLDEKLVVAQSESVHEELRRFLADLQRVVNPQSPPTEGAHDAADARLAAALAKRVQLSADHSPLGKLLEHICDENAVPLYFDLRALRDAQVRLEDEITVSLPEMPLERALEILMGSELAGYARGDVLVVTARVGGELPYAPTAISLRHLDQPMSQMNIVQLILHLQELFDSHPLWVENGGRGIMLPVPNGLAVRQTPEVRRQLAILLTPGTPFSRAVHDGLVEPPAVGVPRLVAALEEDDPWTVALALRELHRLKADPELVRPAIEKMLARDVLSRPHGVALHGFVQPLAGFAPRPADLTRFLVRFMERQRISWQGSSDLGRLPAEFFTPGALESEYLAGDVERRETVCMVIGLLGSRAKDSSGWLTKLLADPPSSSSEHPLAMARWALGRTQAPKNSEPQVPPREPGLCD